MENETDNKDSQVFDLEVAPMESITRAEIDVQIATAHRYPRSLSVFFKRAETMILQDIETAKSCIYRMTRYDKKTKETKPIEGESIRMAEIVAANYGNLRTAAQVTSHTATRVSVRAVCHDLETNNLIAVEKQAKTAYSDGTPYNEDMAIMVANATLSKAIRDAIFRVIPRALLKPLKEKALQLALTEGGSTMETRRENVMKWISYWKIDPKRVFAVLGVKGIEEVGVEHLEIFVGLRTAIKEEDQTVDEAFPPIEIAKPIFSHPAKEEQKKAEAATKAPEAETKAPVAATKEAGSETKAPTAETSAQATETVAPRKRGRVAGESQGGDKAEANRASIEALTKQAQRLKEKFSPQAQQQEQEEAKLGLAPETETQDPANVAQTDEGAGSESEADTQDTAAETETAEESASEPPPECVQLQKAMEEAGIEWEVFANWSTSTISGMKTIPKPTSWAQIPPELAAWFVKSQKGVIAGINSWMKKK